MGVLRFDEDTREKPKKKTHQNASLTGPLRSLLPFQLKHKNPETQENHNSHIRCENKQPPCPHQASMKATAKCRIFKTNRDWRAAFLFGRNGPA
jgi:hypothetical protein